MSLTFCSGSAHSNMQKQLGVCCKNANLIIFKNLYDPVKEVWVSKPMPQKLCCGVRNLSTRSESEILKSLDFERTLRKSLHPIRMPVPVRRCSPFVNVVKPKFTIGKELNLIMSHMIKENYVAEGLFDYFKGNSIPISVETTIDPGSKELLSKMLSSLEEFKPAKIAEAANGFLSCGGDIMKKLMVSLALLGSAYMAISTKKKRWIGAATISALLLDFVDGGTTKPIVNSIMSMVKKVVDRGRDYFDLKESSETEEVLWEAPSGYQSQGLEDYTSGFVTLAFSLFSIVILNKTPPKERLEKFVRSAPAFPKILDGVGPILAAVSDLLVDALNAIHEWFTGDEAPWIPKRTDVAEIDKWAEDTMKFRREFSNEHFEYTIENQTRCENLIARGYELMKRDMSGQAAYKLRRFITEYMRLLKTISEKIKDLAPDRTAFRPQPVCVVLRGNPGVGKTWLTQQMLSDVLADTLPPENWDMLRNDWKSFVYMRTPENEYWEKYRGEWCTIIDDFGQMRDIPGGNIQEFMEIIRMVNNFPYVLHMADIESKGNTFFRSRLVILTTNRTHWKSESIISEDALERRIDFDVEVCIGRSFAVEVDGEVPSDPSQRKLDKSKVADRYDPNIYVLKVKQKGRTTLMTLAQFETVLKRSLEHQEVTSSNYLSDLQANIEKRLEARRNEAPKPPKFVVQTQSDQEILQELKMQSLEDLTYEGQIGEPREPEEWYKSINPCHKDSWNPPDEKRIEKLEHILYAAYKSIAVSWATRKWIDDKMEDHREGIRSDSAALLLLLRTVIETYPNLNEGNLVQIICDPDEEYRFRVQNMADLLIRIESALGENPRWVFPVDVAYWSNLTMLSQQRFRYERNTLLGYIEGCFVKFTEWANDSVVFQQLLALASWAAIIAGGFKLYRYCTASTSDDEEKTKIKETFNAQGDPDANGTQIGIKVAHRNLYTVHWRKDGPAVGYLTVIAGRVGIMPNHYKLMCQQLIEIGNLERDGNIYLQSVKTKLQHLVPVSSLLGLVQTEALKDLDVGLMKLPPTMHSHPDLVKNWVTQAQMRPFPSIKLGMWKCQEDNLFRESSSAVIREQKIRINVGTDSYTVGRVLDYRDIETTKGDCGAPLIVNMASFGPGKILGFHIAGHATNGSLGALVTREELEEALLLPELGETISAPISIDDDDMALNPNRIKMEYEGQMAAPFGVPAVVYGQVERTEAPFLPRDTAIRRSPLYGKWGDAKTEPADIRNKEFKKNAINKFFLEPTLDIKVALFERAAHEYGAHLLQFKQRTRRASIVFDFESACVGSDAVQFFESIPRNTSPGYPHNVRKSTLTGKKRFFGTGEKYDLSGSEAIKLRERVTQVIENAKQGKRSLHIYTDVFKDERLPIGKGKIRAFSASPLELTIAIRMYFLDFVMFMMENRVDNFCGPGMNPNSIDWDKLTQRLLTMGDKIIAGDYSSYDSRHIAELMRCFLITVEIFYDGTEEDKRVRRVLFEDVVNSIHILGQTIYQWSGSLPSGSALTTIVNCVLGVLYMMVAFVSLVKGSKFEDFFSKVYICVFGDDNILAPHPSVIEEFNGVSIQAFMPRVNQQYTPEDKSPVMYKYKSIGDVTFLKRGFRYEPVHHRWVAPLAITSIDEAPYWYRRTADPAETIKSNVDWMFYEYSLHGKEVFDRIVSQRKKIVEEEIGYVSPLSLEWFITIEKALSRTEYF